MRLEQRLEQRWSSYAILINYMLHPEEPGAARRVPQLQLDDGGRALAPRPPRAQDVLPRQWSTRRTLPRASRPGRNAAVKVECGHRRLGDLIETAIHEMEPFDLAIEMEPF